MKKLITPVIALALATGSALAQDNGALLDLLVKKKVITEKDADSVRTELDSQQADSSLNKLKLTDAVTSMTLGGDFRLRYQYQNLDHQAIVANNSDQTSRWRYRLRLNADFQLGPNFFGGVTLATGHSADGNNQTFDNGFANSSIYINRAFIGWKPTDWFVAKVGKQDNPFYTTDLVWDPDIRPAGLVESISFDKWFGGGEMVEDKGLSKDGKSVMTSISTKPKWTLALNLGQLYYSDNNEYNSTGNTKTDAYIFGEQLVGSYDFGAANITFAPSAYFYNAASLTGFDSAVSFQDSTAVAGASRKLTILTAPGDIAFKVMGIPTKFYWDFAYNAQGKGRADDIYKTYNVLSNGTIQSTHKTQDDIAWLAGFQVGQNKKAGDLSFLVNFRQSGITSVDPNLNDSDFALSELNTQGIKAGLSYNFTDSLTGGVTYMYAWNLRKNLIQGEATNDQKIADGNNIQVLQVDLMLKF
jgi:hypothetical protein